MITTTGLSKSFGANVAVDNVSIQVRKQEIFGLVGPDGAGKTTLMRMICGLIVPDSGQVKIMDFPRQQIEKAKEHLGYMPQRFSLYGDLTVMENIFFFGSMYKLDRKTIKQRAEEILQITNLLPFKDRLADNLSGGMKQKLSLTCALVTRPSILVLDEPTYGVDPESRKEFWKILYHLNKEGITILISTPYMDEAELCQVVAFMNKGQIKAIDSPVNLKQNFHYRVLEVNADIKYLDIFDGLPGIVDASFFGDKIHIVADKTKNTGEAARQLLAEKGIKNTVIREIPPSIEDIFIFLAENEVG